MARKLQDRLALASYKTKHGMDTMSFSLVEAHVDSRLKRKRHGSVIDGASDTSSSTSDRQFFSGGLESSPMTAPIYSDDIYGSENVIGIRKKARFDTTMFDTSSNAKTRTQRDRAHSMAPPLFEPSRRSWKSMHQLAESSPIQSRLHPDFRTAHGPNISFVSEVSTIPDSPGFGPVSEDDDQDLPAHSFHLNNSKARASPPRTPPPTRARSVRQKKGNGTGEEGADLLLYLATSPSPANPSTKPQIYAPSTPPSNNAALPSSMMSTPGGTNLFTGFNTPGQQFNFSDFVNVTPSPAQGAFGVRTPGPPKTPLAAREARRRLNFDALMPPGGSPIVSNVGRGSSGTGLGMELGGELVPS